MPASLDLSRSVSLLLLMLAFLLAPLSFANSSASRFAGVNIFLLADETVSSDGDFSENGSAGVFINKSLDEPLSVINVQAGAFGANGGGWVSSAAWVLPDPYFSLGNGAAGGANWTDEFVIALPGFEGLRATLNPSVFVEFESKGLGANAAGTTASLSLSSFDATGNLVDASSADSLVSLQTFNELELEFIIGQPISVTASIVSSADGASGSFVKGGLAWNGVSGISLAPQPLISLDTNSQLNLDDYSFFSASGFDYSQSAEELPLLDLVEQSGDYNGDGFVGQSDLDLVLLNWGQSLLPSGWVAATQINGLISQDELDGVLLNWGSGTPTSVNAVPEPGGGAVVVLGGMAMTARRRRA